MRRLTLLLLTIISLQVQAQLLQGPVGYGKQEKRYKALNYLGLPVTDTICDLIENGTNGTCEGAVVYKSEDSTIYIRTATYWRAIAKGTGDLSNYVPITRMINTVSPLSGGGDLSADRTLSIANAQADGENKGAATFRSDHFDDDTQGAISLQTDGGNPAWITSLAQSKITGLQDSLNKRWSKSGDAVTSGQFLGSTNSAAVVIKTNNDTAILANASKQVFVDTTLTMGDYVYDRKAIPGDPPHVFEVTSSGNTNYLAQFTNFSATTGLANIHVRKARGTKEAPSAVQYGDALASFGFRGYGTNNFGPSSGAFIWFARNNFTDSLHGTECQIQTTAVGANAWYGRTYAFIFGADGSFTIPRAVTAAGDNNVATLSSLTDYANSWLQFNNSNATRRGYIGMFGNTNQLTINADAGSTGTPTVRITNRLLVNTSTDNGSGLMVGGSISAPIATITGSTTLTATQSTVLVNNSGSVTITLPAASGIAGRIYVIKKISAAANDVIIDGNASETIDAAATKTLTLQYSSVIIQSNGTNWFILSSHAAATTL